MPDTVTLDLRNGVEGLAETRRSIATVLHERSVDAARVEAVAIAAIVSLGSHRTPPIIATTRYFAAAAASPGLRPFRSTLCSAKLHKLEAMK